MTFRSQQQLHLVQLSSLITGRTIIELPEAWVGPARGRAMGLAAARMQSESWLTRLRIVALNSGVKPLVDIVRERDSKATELFLRSGCAIASIGLVPVLVLPSTSRDDAITSAHSIHCDLIFRAVCCFDFNLGEHR
jgi:hypothetical protein